MTGSLAFASALALPYLGRAAQATPDDAAFAGLPELTIGLTDTGFNVPQPLAAGRYHVTVENTGTSAASHFALGLLPSDMTTATLEAAMTTGDEETVVAALEKLGFVGVPDWPKPGGRVSGVIDLVAGDYLIFDPFDSRGHAFVTVGGELAAPSEPAADVTVTLTEMMIDLPETAFTSEAQLWKIENKGTIFHEVAVLPVTADFTEEDLKVLFSLPDEATPPPGTADLHYQPIAAIGILAQGHTSWVNVELPAGHYLAACFLPFGTGYPHAVDGMYRFFEVK